MINCEIELDLSWSKECIISEISRTSEIRENNRVTATERTGETFQKNNAKLYVPVVTLSINNNIKFLENIKQIFRNINRLFVLSFKNGNDDPTRDSFEYYMPLVEIKDFIALIVINHFLINQ